MGLFGEVREFVVLLVGFVGYVAEGKVMVLGHPTLENLP